MKLVDFNSKVPEENIALAEVLLLKAEEGKVGETLRFWESPEYFVAIGRAGKIDEDCFTYKCITDGVKIIRRISGGGTVLQGPGCLNYEAVISYRRDNNYRDIKYSYIHLLRKIANEFKEEGENVKFFPISDLALDEKKFSGNAQARKRKFFLHHGTFLYDFNLEKVPLYLKHPKKEPDYREGREHSAFLANISLTRKRIEKLVKKAFDCEEDPCVFLGDDLEEVKGLTRNKYSKDSWNYAF